MDPVQQALHNLKDIHSPAEVSVWPWGIGWWLAAIILVLLLWFLFSYIRNRKYCLRRQAKKELAEVWNEYVQQQDAMLLLQSLSLLLRRCVSVKEKEEFASSLTGEQWLLYLDQGLSSNDFSQGAGRVLVYGPYQKEVPDYEPQHLYLLVNRWINKLPC